MRRPRRTQCQHRQRGPGAVLQVCFDLSANTWRGLIREKLWAEPVGGGSYCLANSPLYVEGVSRSDVVVASAKNGELVFDCVALRGGHSTYWIRRSAEYPLFDVDHYWQPLRALGCVHEEDEEEELLWAVDVPPKVDIHSVNLLLERGQRGQVWTYREGHCGHVPEGMGYKNTLA